MRSALLVARPCQGAGDEVFAAAESLTESVRRRQTLHGVSSDVLRNRLAGAGIYHFSLRDGYMCAWLQGVDPRSKRPIGPPRPVQHFHQPQLRAASRATAASYVAGGALYVTLTETTGNIWTLDTTKK